MGMEEPKKDYAGLRKFRKYSQASHRRRAVEFAKVQLEDAEGDEEEIRELEIEWAANPDLPYWWRKRGERRRAAQQYYRENSERIIAAKMEAYYKKKNQGKV